MSRKLQVATDEILDAMTMSENEPVRFFLDLETGSVETRLNNNLARELCEYHGIAWRNRFIEDTSHHDIERTHLEVDGTTVRLSVDVPLSIWKAFAGCALTAAVSQKSTVGCQRRNALSSRP